MRQTLLAVVFVGVAAATTANAQVTFAGEAYVSDGDTLTINGTRIRLHGIDAPEYNKRSPDKSQYCIRQGASFPCGEAAATLLARHVHQKTVSCTQRDTDRYGRSVAECFVDGQSINRWMVVNGIAIAYRQYSQDYAGDEDLARSRGVGLWAMQFEPPWEFRKRGSK